jgi:hypothetical protein
MPTLSESFEAAKARAVADFEEVKRQMQVVVDASDAKDGIIDQMAQTEVSDQAAIADLTAQRDDLNQQIADAQAQIDAFDLDASFPAAPAPGDGGTTPAPGEPGAGGTTPTEPPVAPDPGTGATNPPEPPAPGEDVPVGTGAGDVGGAPPPPPEVTNPPADNTGGGTAPAPAPGEGGTPPADTGATPPGE